MNYGQLTVKTMSEKCSYKKFIYFYNLLKPLNNLSNRLLQYKGEVPLICASVKYLVRNFVLGATVLSTIGCSSIEKTSLLGLTVGGGIGAIADQGLNENTNKDSMIKNSIIGAVVGLGVGYLLHTFIDNREDKVRKETLFNLEAHGIDQDFKPVVDSEYGNFVTSPYVKEDYIDTHTTDDGRVLIQGHKRWVLIGSPQFNLPAPVKDKN